MKKSPRISIYYSLLILKKFQVRYSCMFRNNYRTEKWAKILCMHVLKRKMRSSIVRVCLFKEVLVVSWRLFRSHTCCHWRKVWYSCHWICHCFMRFLWSWVTFYSHLLWIKNFKWLGVDIEYFCYILWMRSRKNSF